VTRSQLWSHLREVRKQTIVYGTGDSVASAIYRDFANRLAQRRRWLAVSTMADTTLRQKDLAGSMITLIGTPRSNRWLAKMSGRFPFHWTDRGVRIGKTEYRHPKDVVVVSLLPNPLAAKAPLSLITGVSDEEIAAFLRQRRSLRLAVGDYVVFRDGQIVTFGFFDSDWQPDTERERNFLAETRRLGASRHFEFVYHGREPLAFSLEELTARYETWLTETSSRVAIRLAEVKIEVHIYDSFETKGLITGNTDLYHAEPERRRAHVVINNDFRGDRFVAVAKVLLDQWPGEVKSKAFGEALAMALSDGWGRRGYRHWAGVIAASDNIIPLRRLFSTNSRSYESPLFTRPLLGVVGEVLLRAHTGAEVQKLAATWPAEGLPGRLPNGWSVERLELEWRRRLTELARAAGHEHVRSFRPEFQKGFCYSHEGYQIFNGYLSEMSSRSLGQLKELAVNWISLTPFAFVSAMDRPVPFRFSHGPGSENDESILQAATAARKLGMKILLKPHIWTRAGWPGEMKMRSDEEWRAFFDHYYRWIRHYALLAEMYDFDMLSVGVEVSKATLHKPQAWRDMIARIRRIYHGPLVYAANWGEEFEKLTFWDALDYIGLNSYYPLSQSADATREELLAGAQEIARRVEAVAERFQKPVIFTEVGFVSAAAPWVQPHAEDRRSQPDLQAQAMAYQVMFEAMWDKPWFYGFYWWKWPTVPTIGGKRHAGFTPKGKPAASVVAEWYRRQTPERVDE
jgi:arabinogalactan endo-1,4-beta-galactosidase